TLAGAFFSNRARTSAHIAFVTLTGVLWDFIKDLERAASQSALQKKEARKAPEREPIIPSQGQGSSPCLFCC
ncbi:hypothetical protein, partial [Pseudomonas sp. Root401]|uniref:hypothetical protein n=1 Tax=Pseudomonas sp. Root401 TaxID=1736526 RepID=UPI001F3DB30F